MVGLLVIMNSRLDFAPDSKASKIPSLKETCLRSIHIAHLPTPPRFTRHAVRWPLDGSLYTCLHTSECLC
jgi:hypothetical protein